MTKSKYTEAELQWIAEKPDDRLTPGERKALQAWRRRTKTTGLAEDAPTQAERADAALEAVEAAPTGAEDPTATGEPDASAHAEDSAAIGRQAIACTLVTLHNAMLDMLSASFDAGDKVAYAYSCKLLSGEIMDLKANYSKDTK